MRKIAIFLIFFFLFVNHHNLVFAASVTLSEGNPSTINDANQEYQAKVNLSIDASDGTKYYLRGAFYQTGSSNYCGFTWNGSSWFNGPYSTNEGWKNFLPVTISSSSASTVLKAKIDTSDSGCKDNGTYNFKIERFTDGGSGNFDTQNEQSLMLYIPSITPTPTKIPTSVPTISPTSIPAPSATIKPLNSPTNYPSPTKASKSTVTPSVTLDNLSGEVLGVTSYPTVTGEEEKQSSISSSAKSSFPIFAFLMGSGVAFIAGAAVLSARQIKNNKSENSS